MLTLLTSGRAIAEVDIAQISGVRAAGAHRVLLELKVRSSGWTGKHPVSVVTLALDCTVTLRGAEHRRDPIGRFTLQRPNVAMQFHPGSGPSGFSVYLQLDLAPRQIEALEAIRLERDLQLMFDLSAVAHVEGVFQSVDAQFHHTIEREKWLQILEQSGFRETLLVEVALRCEGKGGSIFEHLRSAEAHLRRGLPRDAVADCREAIEELCDLIGNKDSRAKLKQALSDDAEGLSKADRLLALQHALRLFCHPSHHADKVSKAIEYTREDARTILLTTAAVVNHHLTPG